MNSKLVSNVVKFKLNCNIHLIQIWIQKLVVRESNGWRRKSPTWFWNGRLISLINSNYFLLWSSVRKVARVDFWIIQINLKQVINSCFKLNFKLKFKFKFDLRLGLIFLRRANFWILLNMNSLRENLREHILWFGLQIDEQLLEGDVVILDILVAAEAADCHWWRRRLLFVALILDDRVPLRKIQWQITDNVCKKIERH